MKHETNAVKFSRGESSAERLVRHCRCGVIFLLALAVSILAIQAYGQEAPAPMNLNLQQAVQMAL